MPIGGILSIGGAVTATDDKPALFAGYVAPQTEYDEDDYVEPGYYAGQPSPPLLITGTVSRAVTDSFEGPSLFYGVRIKLRGDWIPDVNVTGPIQVKESMDSQLSTFSFGLVGAEYSVLRTVLLFTRVPVEIWFQNGPAGAVRDYLRIAGYVRTCEQTDELEPVFRVDCGDASMLFENIVTCLEIEPFSGVTRGDIVRSLCDDAGLDVQVPDGATYDKPFSSISQNLFQTLKDFGEPEGWYWRVLTDGSLEAYRPDLKLAPIPVDHEWGPEDIEDLQIKPPEGSPSRWVVRGFSVVVVDELGVQTAITTTEIEEIYAPKVAVQQQQTDGTIVDLGAFPEPESLRVTQRIIDQLAKRGNKVVWQYTAQYGWKNFPAAKYYTPDDGITPGPVDGGYYYALANIDESGAYVILPKELFMLVGERWVTPAYDLNDNETGSHTEQKAWVKKTMGVKSVGSATLNCLGACVGADDQSYYSIVGTASAQRPIETYDRLDALDVTYTRDSTGAVVQEQQDSYAHYAPLCLIGPGTFVNRYLRYDGKGQSELVALWKRVGSKTVVNTLLDGSVIGGTIESESGYTVAKKTDGTNDWGDHKSNLQVESFQTLTIKDTVYRVLTSDSYEKTVYETGKDPVITTVQGQLPSPRWKTSPWTMLVQNPIEWSLDDDTALEWFGPSKQVIQNDYLLSLGEAQEFCARRRRRLLADVVTIKRPEANSRPGQTVLVTWPSAGLRHRCLLVDQDVTRDILQADVFGTYALERYR